MILARRCPKCNRPLAAPPAPSGGLTSCPGCRAIFEETQFPARDFVPAIATAAALSAGEASCFFHPQNRAEVACEGCGRYICPVCRVDLSGQLFCPSCLANRGSQAKLPENFRVLYGSIALGLAVVPLLIWPFTILTAPAALILSFYAWNKRTGILQGGRRTRLIVACTVAACEIFGWMYFGYALLHRAPAAPPSFLQTLP